MTIAPGLDTITIPESGQLVPNVSILTTKSLEGTGVFDVLMQTAQLYLQEEYDNNRITGKEYTTVYLGAFSAVLQQSIAFLANHQMTAKTDAEIALVRQKTVTELCQTDDDIPLGLGFNGDTLVEGLVKTQKDLAEQQILTATQETEKTSREVDLLGQKIITELAQTDNELTGAVGYGFNASLATVEGLVKAETIKAEAEADLTKQKVMTELAATSDAVLDDYAKNIDTDIAGLMKEQIAKVASEVQLLNQKAITELAQTEDITPASPNLGEGGTVAGVTGVQKTLYAAQTDGFARDAEQKLLKLMVDPLIAKITGDTNISVPAALENPSIDSVFTKAKSGIGVATVNTPPSGSVTIIGIAAENVILTADTSAITDNDVLGPFSYQWQRDGLYISGATASTYTLVTADVGSVIRVGVSYTDGNGNLESLLSANTAQVSAA